METPATFQMKGTFLRALSMWMGNDERQFCLA
jgi:hypothetical protein